METDDGIQYAGIQRMAVHVPQRQRKTNRVCHRCGSGFEVFVNLAKIYPTICTTCENEWQAFQVHAMLLCAIGKGHTLLQALVQDAYARGYHDY